ncbi:MAG: hypothetical protein AAFQ79_03840 [Pseudomonadota bacterium]
MTQTTTACQNVCEDAGWALSALEAVAPAIVGGLIALYIATHVYQRQRQIDSEKDIMAERREVLRQFFSSVAVLHSELRAAAYRGDDWLGHLAQAEVALHKSYQHMEMLAFTEPAETIEACRTYMLSLLAFRAHVRNYRAGIGLKPGYKDMGSVADVLGKVLDCRERALIQARETVLEDDIPERERALSPLFFRMNLHEEFQDQPKMNPDEFNAALAQEMKAARK